MSADSWMGSGNATISDHVKEIPLYSVEIVDQGGWGLGI